MTTRKEEGEKPDRVRVWWEPTDNKSRDGYAGAYWPAKVLARNKNKMRVQYDNGDTEEVHLDHVSPIDTLPIGFGEEEEDIKPGEFCEVSNGSKTDPCAWFGRVVKASKNGSYVVEYPLHNAKPERIEPKHIRRARVMEDGEWWLIKPGQDWGDGEVTSPMELELIHEDDLEEILEEISKRNVSGKDNQAAGKRTRDIDEEHEEEESSKKQRNVKVPKVPKPPKPQSKQCPAPVVNAGRGRPRKVSSSVEPSVERAAEAGGVAGLTIEERMVPKGMVSLYVNVEPGPRGGICFVPTNDNTALPGSVQVYFLAGVLPTIEEEAAKQGLLQPNEAIQAAVAQAMAVPNPPKKVSAGKRASSSAGHGAPEAEDKKGLKGKKEGPRRPKSAWNVFVERNKGSFNEGKSHVEACQILGVKWKEASAEEKALCEAEAERDRIRFNSEVAAAGMSSARGTQAAPKEPFKPFVIPGAPAAPRTAQQLYTAEFLKALNSSVQGTSVVTGSAATLAATSAWNSAEAVVRSRYQDKEVHDRQRYEKELHAWLDRPETQCQDQVLKGALDLREAKQRISDLGYRPEAFQLLLDAWRKDSPLLPKAIRAVKLHIQIPTRPDWEAFLPSIFGPERAADLKGPGKGAQEMENQPIGSAIAS